MTKSPLLKKSGNFLKNNIVLVMMLVLTSFLFAVSEMELGMVANQVAERFARNTCLVLALIIPCLAGLGMNFGIVAGAMAAQISVFFCVHYGAVGTKGFIISALVATPLAIILGYFLGLIFNKTKGAEMIAGLVFGFFADGVYRLFVLYIIGGVIPFDDPNLLDRGFGLRNTFELGGNIGGAIDNINFFQVALVISIVLMFASIVGIFTKLKDKNSVIRNIVKFVASGVLLALTFVLPKVQYFAKTLGAKRLKLNDAALIFGAIIGVYFLGKFLYELLKKKNFKVNLLVYSIIAFVIFALTFIPATEKVMKYVNITPASYAIIVLFCFLNNWLFSTKLGQDMRTVGQSRAVATSAGINVNKTRIIATCISTVLAAWGQLIFLQNLGTFNTVKQQTNVGLYAVAAILVGGANVKKATNKQAIIGVLLFHTLFVVTPEAAKQLFGDPAVGEYIRMFVSYGVIAVALAMYVYQTIKKGKKKANA